MKGGKRKGAGAPYKYGEPQKQIHPYFPLSWIAKLDKARGNLSRSEYIISKVKF